MNTKEFLSLLKKRKGTVTAIVLIFLIVGTIATLGQPLKYRAKSRLLILQPNANADAYAVARANEYIGGLISEVAYSGSFLDSLNSSAYTFDRSYFDGSYKDNIKKWKKTISAKNNGDTGVIDIEVYHTDPQEALKIAQAVDQLIVSDQSPYRFDANQVKLNVIDQPIVSSFPVKPNLLANLALSLLFGFLAGCSYIYLFPRKKVAHQTNRQSTAKADYQERRTIRPPYVPDNLPINESYRSSNRHQQKEPYQEQRNSGQEPTTPEEPFAFRGDIRNILDE